MTKAATQIHLCTFRTVPAIGAECREMLWSEGRACRRCPVDCYRRGWKRVQVFADNARMIEERRRRD